MSSRVVGMLALAAAACAVAPAASPDGARPGVIGNRPSAKRAPVTPRCATGMAGVLGGAFSMGSPPGHPRGDADEVVASGERWVSVSSFCIDRTEVTVAAYARCVRAGACTAAAEEAHWDGLAGDEQTVMDAACNGDRPDRQDHPVNCVDWEQAVAYCRAQHATLPTEAQWEYTVRTRHDAAGVHDQIYPWGDADPTASRLNACGPECADAVELAGLDWSAMYDDPDGHVTTAPVGGFRAGDAVLEPGNDASRVHDLAGNVREWTLDDFAPYDAGTFDDPVVTRDPKVKTVRGGGWRNGDRDGVRGAFRHWYATSIQDPVVGFRCVRAVDSPR